MKFGLTILLFLIWIGGLWIFIPVYDYLTSLHKFVGGLSTVYLTFAWSIVIARIMIGIWEQKTERRKHENT